MGKVEVLSKSASDWLSATAKGDRYQCTFRYRTSIPYGKGKDGKSEQQKDRNHVSIPYGKGKDEEDYCYCCSSYPQVSIPYGKGKEKTVSRTTQTVVQVSIPNGKGKAYLQ